MACLEMSKDQRIKYAYISNRLNIAYWQSVHYQNCIEHKVITKELREYLAKIDDEIRTLIDKASQEKGETTGIARDLVERQIIFVNDFVSKTMSVSKRNLFIKMSEASHIRSKEVEVDYLINIEKKFITEQNMFLNEDDLSARFDRGIYLIYEVIQTAESTAASSFDHWCSDSSMQNKLSIAKSIFSLPLNEMYKKNQIFLDGLDLVSKDSSELAKRLTLRFDELYKNGLALLQFVEVNLFFRFERLSSENKRSIALERLMFRYLRKQQALDQNLVNISKLISRDILKALDTSKVLDKGG